MAEFETSILFEAIYLVLVIAGLPLLSGMLVGLVVSVLQAATQIQEQTLSFIPKLFVVSVVLMLCVNVFAQEFQEFFSSLFERVIIVGRA